MGANPKSMAPIGGQPFLALLLNQLSQNGFERVILATGYRGEVIQEHFGNQASGLKVTYSFESSPLGTGGALRKAADFVTSDLVLVMNGDSYTEANLHQYVSSHLASETEVSIVVVPVDGRTDCGTVTLDPNAHIAEFVEKAGSPKAPYVNAGIYILPRTLLCEIPDRPISLERELIPRWIQEARNIRGLVCQSTCVDIGTPERYCIAKRLLPSSEAERQVEE
jgi:mannose-1-phosphate guanylyltransferase